MSHSLNYGSSTGSIGRKSLGLILIVLAAAILFPLASWIISTPQWARYKMLRAQDRLLKLSFPPEQVMYEEDPADCMKLLNLRYYQRSVFAISGVSEPANFPVIFLPPTGSDQHLQQVGLPLADQPMLFEHERTSPAGHHRLVFITTHAGWSGDVWNTSRYPNDLILPSGQRIVPICYATYTLLNWNIAVKSIMSSFIGPCIQIGVNDRWRMEAGQPDPADPTRFTLGYAINGQPGTIEGWLRDNETLHFRIVNGPATTRPVEHIDVAK